MAWLGRLAGLERDVLTIPSSFVFSKGTHKMEVGMELWESTTEIGKISASETTVYDRRGI
jgi:hypothetical protein